MNPLAADFDRISLDELRAGGGIKWAAFPDCIGAFIAEMDFGTAPVVTAALHEAADRAYHGYLPDTLLHELGRACADWHHTRYGWTVPAEWVHAVPDVLYALEITLRHFVPPGVPVLLPTPNYMPFLPLLEMLGNPVVQVPMRRVSHATRADRVSDLPHAVRADTVPDVWREAAPADARTGTRAAAAGWEFDYHALDAAFAGGARLAILCNPHNPIGRVYTREELRRFAVIAERHGARVFTDEIHAPLVYGGHRHVPYASVSEQAAAHAVTATSASKAWNIPGLKCAQLLLTCPDDQRLWRRIGFLAGHGTATPGVLANIAAYREGGPWLEQVLQYLEGNRALLGRLLRELLPEVGYVEPEGTYLAWLDCRPLQPRLPLPAQRLFRRDARVALTRGEDCGEAGAGHVRLNFAMPRPILREAVERMARAVAGRVPSRASPRPPP